MNIVYFYPSLHYPGGMERVLTTKMNYLADVLGYHVSIITHRQFGRPKYFPLSDNVKVIELNRYEPNAEELRKLGRKERISAAKDFFDFYKTKVEDYLLHHPTDICISTLFGRDFDFLPDIKDGSIKMAEYHFSFSVSALSNFQPLSKIRSLKQLKDHYYQKKFIKNAQRYHKFIVLTEKDAQYWRKHIPKADFIHNPITIEAGQASKLTQRKALAVGRFGVQKNYPDLIKAWEIVADKHPDWKLEIYGDGDLKQEIISQIENKNLSSNIEIQEPIKDIGRAYNHSSIYLMTSLFEGLPLVLMEAIYYGLPAVSYDCDCGPSDLIDNGKSGYLVTTGDYKSLAEKIIILIENEPLRHQMGRLAIEKSKEFSVEKIMLLWDKLFKKSIQENA